MESINFIIQELSPCTSILLPIITFPIVFNLFRIAIGMINYSPSGEVEEVKGEVEEVKGEDFSYVEYYSPIKRY